MLLFETNTEKVLEIFVKKPTEEFKYRELTKITKLGSSTIKRALSILIKRNLIKKIKTKNHPYYQANRESKEFKTIKIFYTLNEINKEIDKIIEKTRPTCIVLFGSASKGEDTENSDIDLFIQSQKKEISLDRKINILFEPDIKKINKELLNNLANGITLYGFLEVKA